jgi:hypothetical protein
MDKNDSRWYNDYACRKAWKLIYQDDNQNPNRIWIVMGKEGITTHISASAIINNELKHNCKQYLIKY